MWVATHETARQLNTIKQHLNAVLQCFALQRAKVMHGFGNLIRQLHLRVQRCKGVLENHLHIKACIAQTIGIQRHNVFATKTHSARLRINKAQNRTTGSGFATARFPNQT